MKDTMESYKIVGALGACILAAGVFMPSRFLRMVGYASYFTDHQTNGLLLSALAVVALLLVYKGSATKLYLFGMLTLAMVAWAYTRHGIGLQNVEASVGKIAAQATAMPLFHQAAFSVNNSTPWWVMLCGSGLMVIAGLMQARRA